MSDEPVTPQDLEDAAYLLLLSVEAYIGPDKSALEIAGAAHTVLSIAIQELNKKHEQTQTVGYLESPVGIEAGPAQIQEAGESRGISASTQGTIETVTTKTPADRPVKRYRPKRKGTDK